MMPVLLDSEDGIYPVFLSSKTIEIWYQLLLTGLFGLNPAFNQPGASFIN